MDTVCKGNGLLMQTPPRRTAVLKVPPPGRRRRRQRRRGEPAGSSEMGPLRESKKEQRVQHQEKEISRSRIPRLILRPHRPQQQQQQQNKVSPASESPFSEEESREFNPSSSGRSARTISSNSFCSGQKQLLRTQTLHGSLNLTSTNGQPLWY